MSTGADRTDSQKPTPDSVREHPQAPPRPTVPPRPAAPPRPSFPPMPSSPPSPPPASANGGAAASGSAGSAGPSRSAGSAGDSGNGTDGGAGQRVTHTQRDEPTRQMPQDPEADEVRTAASPAPSATRPRPPVPTAPPQPPPPTGEPLTARNLLSGRPLAEPRATERFGAERPPGRPPMPAATAFDGIPDPAERDEDPFDSGPSTAELRPIRDKSPHHKPAPRTVAAAACLVLGVGLLGGAAAGMTWLTDDPDERTPQQTYDQARALWETAPVDQLFPKVLEGRGAGPGSADRRWVRVAVAPDSNCRGAFDPLLSKALSPVGCGRLLRATYADETTSSVTTVGLVFTRSDVEGMASLRKRFAVENLSERTDLLPRPYSARGTVAADFGDAQRASWTLRVLSDAPVVVYAVTGFADGRTVSDPQAAAEATEKGETSAAAQAGLGHDAQGIADRIERRLRDASAG
jgi:hypothetical protein